MKCPRCGTNDIIIQEITNWDKTITFYRVYCNCCKYIGHCYDTIKEAEKEISNE